MDKDLKHAADTYFQCSNEKVCSEIVEYIMSKPELYTAVLEAFAKDHEKEMLAWFNSEPSEPDVLAMGRHK